MTRLLIGALLVLALVGGACGPPERPTTVGQPATSVVPPEIVPGAAPAPKPALASPVAAKPSPVPSPVASPAPSPVAARDRVAVTANGGETTLSVVDLAQQRLLGHIELGRQPHAVALAPDGSLALVTDNTEGSRAVLVVAEQGVVREIEVGSRPHGVVFLPMTGQAAVTNSGDSSVSLVDPRSQQVQATIQVGTDPRGIAVAATGGATRLFVANHGDGTLSVVDVQRLLVETTVQIGGQPGAVAVTPGGDRVVVLDEQQARVVVLDGRTFQPTAMIRAGFNPTGLAVSAAGDAVWVAASDATRNLWKIDLATYTLVEEFRPAGGAGATAVTAGRDPSRIYLTTQDGKLVVFDTLNNQQVASVGVGAEPSGVAVALPEAVGAPTAPAPIARPEVRPTLPRVDASPTPAR